MIKKFDQFISEMIKVPIKVGDTVLGGRFKNKKIVVKKIGKNDKGDITINGKPLLKFRIIKESRGSNTILDLNDIFQELKDNDFIVDINFFSQGQRLNISVKRQGHKRFKYQDIKEYIERCIDYLISKGWEANRFQFDAYSNVNWEDADELESYSYRNDTSPNFSIIFHKI